MVDYIGRVRHLNGDPGFAPTWADGDCNGDRRENVTPLACGTTTESWFRSDPGGRMAIAAATVKTTSACLRALHNASGQNDPLVLSSSKNAQGAAPTQPTRTRKGVLSAPSRRTSARLWPAEHRNHVVPSSHVTDRPFAWRRRFPVRRRWRLQRNAVVPAAPIAAYREEFTRTDPESCRRAARSRPGARIHSVGRCAGPTECQRQRAA